MFPIVADANDSHCFKLGSDTPSNRCRFGQIATKLLPLLPAQGYGEEALNQDAERFFIAPTLGNAVPVIFLQITRLSLYCVWKKMHLKRLEEVDWTQTRNLSDTYKPSSLSFCH